MASPFLSVVISTRQRMRPLTRCLESLCEQSYSRDQWELIIVHDGEDPESEKSLEGYKSRLSIRSLRRAHAGCGLARNAGAAEAVGTYVIFTDDDCLFPADWLSRFDQRFRQDPDCLIAGAFVNELPSNPYSQTTQVITEFLLQFANSSPDNARLALGNNMGMPAAVFAKLQGFSASYYRTAAEDRDLCARWLAAGGRILYDPNIVVRHAHELTLQSFCRQHYHYGRGSFVYHRLEAQRQHRPLRLERAGFYFSLLARAREARIRFLVVVSQVAHVLGFASGYLRPGPGAGA